MRTLGCSFPTLLSFSCLLLLFYPCLSAYGTKVFDMNQLKTGIGSAFKKVSHVIFDMDGLLLDTEIIYTQATVNIVSQYGKTFDWSIKVQLMGLHGDEVAKKIVQLLDLPITPEEYYKLALEQYDLLMSHCELKPGAEKLIKHLHHHKIPIAVATSSSQKTFDIKATNHQQLFSHFNHIVCGGSDPEVKKGKPNPDIFLICASRFGDKPKPENCLVFEDAPNGITAAVDANMQCVMVPDPNVDKTFTKDATLVIDSLEDFKPELFGLPPIV